MLLIEKEKVATEKKVIKSKKSPSGNFSKKVVDRFSEIGISPEFSVGLRTSSNNILNNHVYVSQGTSEKLEIAITGSIDVKVDMSTQDVYEELIEHLALKKFWSDGKEIDLPLYDMGKIIESLDGYKAIRIVLNNLHTLGYYLPEKNTFVFGNIVWHDHYLSIVLRNVWPQILEKLNLG